MELKAKAIHIPMSRGADRLGLFPTLALCHLPLSDGPIVHTEDQAPTPQTFDVVQSPGGAAATFPSRPPLQAASTSMDAASGSVMVAPSAAGALEARALKGTLHLALSSVPMHIATPKPKQTHPAVSSLCTDNGIQCTHSLHLISHAKSSASRLFSVCRDKHLSSSSLSITHHH